MTKAGRETVARRNNRYNPFGQISGDREGEAHVAASDGDPDPHRPDGVAGAS